MNDNTLRTLCSDELMTATTLRAKALYANIADTEEELSFAAGDLLTVHERDVAGLVGWWLCSNAGRIGIAPGNRLRLVSPTDDDDSTVAGSRNNRGVQTDESSTTVKPRPATAPQRGLAAPQNGNSDITVSVGCSATAFIYVT